MGRMAQPCVVCGKELFNVFEDCENQPEAGLAFVSHGHYGCTVFDPMDGQKLELNICDDCLVKARDQGRVLLGRDTRMVMCGTEMVGSQRVDRPSVQWKEGLGDGDYQTDVLQVAKDEIGSEELTDQIDWSPGGLLHREEREGKP